MSVVGNSPGAAPPSPGDGAATGTAATGIADRPWRDPALAAEDRVRALVAAMTLDEKLAQLGSAWLSLQPTDGGLAMAPHHQELSGAELNYLDEPATTVEEATGHGIGQLTRVYGTLPLDPLVSAAGLADVQRRLRDRTRLGIPAVVHEECLSGLTAFRAAAFPTPLAWAAAFDVDSVRRMAGLIGADMRALGVHQGLSPVLDVVRDYRWGRVEETLGEDPHLVGVLGAAFVAGLQGAGVVATPKHFAGYSASTGGRNLAPVSMGPREFRDVVLPPFETAFRHGGARAVMLAYTSVDGVPPAADRPLVEGLLRREWGFDGLVVSDYYGVSFLQTQQMLADSPAAAAEIALTAGVDVELPVLRCYGVPLAELVRSGRVPEDLVDRSLTRVLRQKVDLGLLDPDWDPEPDALADGRAPDLDSAAHRDVARVLAERSVVLLRNDGLLPLRDPARIALVGPVADDPYAFLGCYAFPNHVRALHPDVGTGVDIPTLLTAVRAEFPGAEVRYAPGCDFAGPDRDGFAAAVEAARGADVCVAVLGDRSGLFGDGTSGEGCDVTTLALPGRQGELLAELLATGTRTVLVTVSGRPYAIAEQDDLLGARVQAFFPGEEAASALAGVLSGRVGPTGRLPVQVPRHPDAPPGTYLHAALAGRSDTSVVDPTPAYPFGHGLGYTEVDYADLELSGPTCPTDGSFTVGCTVANRGDRATAEVVQLYLADPVAPVVRPVRELIGFARVELAAGARARVTFTVHADRTSFTGLDLHRVVEPGRLVLSVGRSAGDLPLRAEVELVGPARRTGADRVLLTPVEVTHLPAAG
ncbi:glycoside hydrolase family 3 N-terminal domain-containing protein [Saccharothrix syringae]|uniref:Glycosyl hydrolase n=1 Tax=Saccharothrix syringae TaxID=103733 RepID=A0A5Q0GZS4_SACSY|nr:glycoside hydrolase family 3 N-terminal domain-containing protein [Saccharothrix syringae]QFZ18902.1 glycosyl hydrolase [Saccharothrix syringae]